MKSPSLFLVLAFCMLCTAPAPVVADDGSAPFNDGSTNATATLQAPEEPVLTEDWESGAIRPDRWEGFGWPRPAISSPGFDSAFAFDARGDSFCDSGVHTDRTFTLQGQELSFVGKVGRRQSHFEDVAVGVTQDELRPSPCVEGGYKPLVSIRIRGDDNRFWVQYLLPGERHQESSDGDWHHYRMVFLDDGRVEFYRDGELRYRSTSTVDPSTFDSQRIFVAGRSAPGAPVLIDDIVFGPSTAEEPETETQPGAGLLACQGSGPGPVVVVTHGWQPTGSCEGDPPLCPTPEWATAMRSQIRQRLGNDVVACTFTWPRAFGLLPALDLDIFQVPFPYVEPQGVDLAEELSLELDRLGCDPASCPLHMIGHSYGAIVNAKAVSVLAADGFSFPQVTLLDPALLGTRYSERTFQRLLPAHPTVTWVDNHIAQKPLDLIPLPIGQTVDGAAEDGGFLLADQDHETIPAWYLGTMSEGEVDGFHYAAFLGDDGGFADRPAPRIWRPMVLRQILVELLVRTLDAGGSVGWRIVTGQVRTITVLGRTLFELSESSDSAMALDVTVPAEADLLTFDLLFAEPGDGDWMTVRLDGELLYSFRGDTVSVDDFVRAEIPLEGLQGTGGELEVRLHGIGESNAELLVGDFAFIGLEENHPPVADAGEDVTAPADPQCRATVTLDGSASSDPDDDPLSFVWEGPDGQTWTGPQPTAELGLGEHEIVLTVDDGRGGFDDDEVLVVVEDVTAPEIVAATASPDLLWPPNHKMVPVTLTVEAQDNCAETVACEIVSVSSNEPVGGTRGDRGPDWEITGPLTLDLRAERSGRGNGRVYSVGVMCADDAGNVGEVAVEVSVPHDRRR